MTPSHDLKRYAVLTMIVGGAVLALSGLCTGIFVASGPDGYVPNALGVLGIGMIGMIPSAILFFSALRILNKGPSLLPGILVLLIAVPLFALSAIGLVNMIIEMGKPYPTPIMFLLFGIAGTLISLAMTVFGVKTVRDAGKKPPEVDTF